jgi:hypothetical protein
MINDSMERSSTLKHRIDLLGPRIANELEEASFDPSNFALNFVANANLAQLQTLEQELKESLIGRSKELMEFRLVGPKIGYGNAPVQSLGMFLTDLQDVFDRIGQALVSGPKERGKVPSEIKLTNQLCIDAIGAGSFRMTISGQMPDSGMFDKEPNVHNDNLLTKSILTFFNVLEVEEPTDEISSLGIAASNSFKNLFSSAVEAEIDVETSWVDLNGSIRRWLGTKEKMAQISYQLAQLEEPEVFPVEYLGHFIELHLERNKFEFRTTDDDILRGMFTEKAKKSFKKIDFDFFEQHNYKATFDKEVIRNRVTRREKVIWTLTDVSI